MGLGLGFLKVLGKSIGKAAKNTGIAVITAGGTSVGFLLMNPEIMAPIWAATGFVGPIVLIGLSMAGQTIVDLVKHKDKM